MWASLAAILKSRSIRLALTVLLIGVLYWAADWSAVVRTLGRLNPWYLAAAMLLFAPQTLVSALRWRQIVSRWESMSIFEALRQTLVASAANLALPSKLGDFSKSAMLPADSTRPITVGPRLVVVEKIADVAALVLVVALGFCGCPWPIILAAALFVSLMLRLLPTAPAQQQLQSAKRGASKRDMIAVAAASMVLWCLHVWQIDLFLRAAGVIVTSDVAAARIPLALFAGVIPLSLWGVGTRDAALIALFADVADPAPLAAVGMLTALRYLVPGACGVLLLAGRSASRAAVASSSAVESSALLTRAATPSSR